MIGPLGKQGLAATLGQHCPQMTQRRCKLAIRPLINVDRTRKSALFVVVRACGDLSVVRS